MIKIEITMSVTNTAINQIMGAMDLGIDRITQTSHIISFETSEDIKVWLSEERKKEFEKKYNEEIKEENLYFIVDKIIATSV